ncbi:MAG: hypothetical protein ACLT4Y_07275 [Bifidobacterium breve]
MTYQYMNGIKDYVDYMVKNRKATPVERMSSTSGRGPEAGISAEIAMRWTAYSRPCTPSRTRSPPPRAAPTEGFRAALTSLVNRYAREKNILRRRTTTSPATTCARACRRVRQAHHPAVRGPDQDQTGNSGAKTFVQRVTDKLGWFDAHPNEAKSIIQRPSSVPRAYRGQEGPRNTRRKSIFESAGMPDKLKDCQSNNPEECELFIVEAIRQAAPRSRPQPRHAGDPAAASKILNTERASIDRMMKSDTISR